MSRSLIRPLTTDQAAATAIDANGQTIWIADAHRGDGKHFVVRADEKLAAFFEVEATISAFYSSTHSCMRP
jgi:hypothetical protein